MADFNTHVIGAAAASSLAATICMKLINLPVADALLLTSIGTIGGVLPDIDLKYSTPSKLLFGLLGTLLAMSWLFSHIEAFTVLELWVIALLVFLSVRFPLWWLFHQFTTHRGALHSLAAAMMFSFATAAAGEHLLNLSASLSWLLAIFMAAGYVLHLALDEAYSVDFMGARIKRSFGSALKILDSQKLLPSCVVLFVALVVWFWTPTAAPIVDQWKSIDTDWLPVLLPDYLLSD
jgi:hypothetical protein